MEKSERKEKFHLVLKSMEKHKCNFVHKKYFYNKYTRKNELWWECDHEGCNTVESDEFRNKTGFFATNPMSIQEKLFPWAVVVILILGGLLFWMWYENGRNQTSAALDRETLLKGNAHLKSELKLRDSVVLTIQNDRASDSAEHAVKQGSLKSQINGLKRQLLENPESLVIRDTIILKQDTLITDLENERDSLKISYQEEIRVLGQSRLALETAYDSTFNQLLTVNDNLIGTEKKLSKMEKLAKTLGISTATLAVICVVLAVL